MRKKSTRSRHWLRLGVFTVLLGLSLVFGPATTWAHPLGNFSVNRYSRLEVHPSQVDLHYILDMAEIPTFQELARIDANHDEDINAGEREHYLEWQLATLHTNLHLTINGTRLVLAPQERQLEFLAGQGGLRTLRLSARFTAPLPQQQRVWQAEYRDDNYPDRLGWQEIVVQAHDSVQLLDSTVPSEDLTQELRVYPEDLLQSPLAVSRAQFRFQPIASGAAETSTVGVGQDAAAASRSPISNLQSQDRFAALITTTTLGPVALLVALLAAFGLGATHALTPGHGKTVVAAYLVGARGTTRHALFLGLTTTITHTAGVFVLGLMTLLLSEFILPEQLYPWLSVISGILVCAIGVTLFRERLRKLVQRWTMDGGQPTLHRHDHHDHDHHHHDHDHHHGHDHHHHHHDNHGHSHLPPGADGTPVTWRGLLALGISGGLLPCPSALVVLLSAIAFGRVGFGLLLIVAFSLGLASVLTAIGLLLVHARRLFERIPVRGRLTATLPVASALVVTLIGAGITLQALVHTGLLRFQ